MSVLGAVLIFVVVSQMIIIHCMIRFIKSIDSLNFTILSTTPTKIVIDEVITHDHLVRDNSRIEI